MNQGILVSILSIFLYLSSLLGGGQGQPIESLDPPLGQQSYAVLGRSGVVAVDRITLRRSPSLEAQALGTVTREAKVTVLDHIENWYKIRPRTGVEGWVPDYAVIVQESVETGGDQIVLGFFPGGLLAYESLLENGAKLTGLSALGWELDRYGKLSASFDHEEMGRTLYLAGNREMDTYAHIRLAVEPSYLLELEHLQQDTLAQILDLVDEWGLKGVLLDLAYLPGSEQNALFGFLNNLADNLRQEGKKSMAALPWDASIDYGAAGEAVDYLVLKTSPDPLPGQPGSGASTAEVEAMLQEITASVAPETLILGLSTGGIHWPRSGLPRSLSHQEVLELAAQEGARVKWDTASKLPFFTYNGGEVWFENRYSLQYKMDLAEEFRLGGLALFNLGQEDDQIWARL